MSTAASFPKPGWGAASRPFSRKRANVAAAGEPSAWLSAGGLTLSLVMILGLLLLVLVNGTRTFWPSLIAEVTTIDGSTYLGEVARVENYRPDPGELAEMPPDAADRIRAHGGVATRRLIRVGNYDIYGNDFHWIADHEIASIRYPAEARVFERREWGPFFGFLDGLSIDGVVGDAGALDTSLARVQAIGREIEEIEDRHVAGINYRLERSRLRLRKAELDSELDADRLQQVRAQETQEQSRLELEHETYARQLEELREAESGHRLRLSEIGGRQNDYPASQVVRTYLANQLTFGDKLGIYFSRWWEFLTAEPREANTEGGVFPAIFGTVLMTILMSVVVGPFGVIAAIYPHEYAKQGRVVSAIRVSVGNLAGVPSIVYGIFGLGFFCYGVGGLIDRVFFSERLPSPTFGTTGILWSSLTLALLTLPVVIVAAEEALASVPNSMREGSLACGASRWQTIRRIVLPKALPGIMTGLILAMARGAGEVAPLMITGAVKLAPELPFDSHFPYVHLERSFMHLGFHIYDVGFQSRNSEAGKPMVFTTTLLLIAIVAALNLSAILLRARVRRKFKEA